MKKIRNIFCASIILLVSIISSNVYAENITGYQITNIENVSSPNKKDETLEIHYINPNSRVDAIFIKVGDKSIFIDGGFYNDAKVESQYIKNLGITQIDYYIGTHAHSDHVGAGGPIIETFKIKNIYASPSKSGSQNAVYKMILKNIDNNASKTNKTKQTKAVKACELTALKAGTTLNINDLKITCLGPVNVKSVTFGSVPENNNSLILRLDYGGASFLLTGDATSTELKESNSKYPDKLNATVLKNPHHNGALSEAVLKYINPKYVIFTTKDGYIPSSSYLKLIKKLGAKYYICTNKKDKDIVVTSDGDTISVTSKGKTETTKIEYNVSLKNTNVTVKTGRTTTLKASDILPKNSELSWTSSNTSIATVDSNGIVKGIQPGRAVITVRNSNKVAACLVKVEDPPVTQPIHNYTQNGTVVKKYSDDTINVSVEKISKYYVTKIWVEEPDKQINKKEAGWNKTLATVNTMLNGTQNAIVGSNGSGFYLSGSWAPRESKIKNLGTSKWNKTTEGYLVISSGIIRRQIKGEKTNALLGILPNGSLKYYERNEYSEVINDGVKNTFTFGPLLIKDGKAYKQKGSPRQSYGSSAKRTSIGQVDENNFIMITTRDSNTSTLNAMATLGVKLDCKLLYNLDGGGSTSLWFRKGLSGNGKQVQSSSRKVGDTIYFTSGM